MDLDQTSLSLFSVALVLLVLIMIILLLHCYVLHRNMHRDVTEIQVFSGPTRVLTLRTQQAQDFLQMVLDRIETLDQLEPGQDWNEPDSEQPGPSHRDRRYRVLQALLRPHIC